MTDGSTARPGAAVADAQSAPGHRTTPTDVATALHRLLNSCELGPVPSADVVAVIRNPQVETDPKQPIPTSTTAGTTTDSSTFLAGPLSRHGCRPTSETTTTTDGVPRHRDDRPDRFHLPVAHRCAAGSTAQPQQPRRRGPPLPHPAHGMALIATVHSTTAVINLHDTRGHPHLPHRRRPCRGPWDRRGRC